MAEASLAESCSADYDTDSTQIDGYYDSELDSDVDMGDEDDQGAPDRVDLHGNVIRDWDGDDEEEDDEDEQDADEEDEDMEEDKDEE